MQGQSAPVTIRPLSSRSDYQACVALQHEIWGEAFEAVPAVMLQVSTYVGGLVIGAFDARAQLVGIVFGLTGVSEGKTIHWSHLLGVRDAVRNTGVGRMLKDRQRTELSRLNIGEMYWSFDPLIAKNAHLNLDVLGARVVRYVPNMYGDTSSPLHHNLPTDRMVVVCDTTTDQRVVSPAPPRDDMSLPLLTAEPRAGDPPPPQPGALPPRIRLEIPTDFELLMSEAPEVGKRWHAMTRNHFEWAHARGYAVTGFRRDPTSSRCFYVLALAP